MLLLIEEKERLINVKLLVNKRTVHEMFNGKGNVDIYDIADSSIMGEKNRCFLKIVLSQDTSLGLHKHKGESEIYYVLQGRGKYYDNSEEYELYAGESVICRDGDIHGILNTEKEDMVLIALVVNT